MPVGDFEDADDPNVATQMVRAIIAEVNVLRKDPAAYADQMEQLQACYRDHTLTYPHSGLEVETTEGAAALQDCLSDLRNAQPMPTVMLSEAISRSCQRHLADLQASDSCDHIGSDGSTPEERLAFVGVYREQCGENAAFGMRSAKEIVYHMLLDDGAPERGQRANLLNHDFHFAGVAFGSHPSVDTAVVMLLADTFRAVAHPRPAQLKAVAEHHLGEAAPMVEGEHPAHGAHRHWDRLVQETKPAHLRVPTKMLDRVHEMVKPKLYIKPRERLPIVYLGQLKPQASVDSVVVRAFLHRIDGNYDDQLEEVDVLGLCHRGQLALSPDDVVGMFDEICERRPIAEQRRRQLSPKEVCAAVQTRKRYVPVVDVLAETAGGHRHTLVIETDALVAWCAEVHSTYSARCAAPLPPPPSAQPPRSAPRNAGGAERAAQLNAFLGGVVAAELADGGDGGARRLLQDEPKVRQVLRLTGNSSDPLARAVCMSQRKLWAFQVRQWRDAWLQLIRASGLNPLIPLPTSLVSQTSPTITVEAGREDRDATNVARPDAMVGPSVPSGTGKMQTRALPQRVQVRSVETTGVRELDPTTMLSTASQKSATMPPWEERRHQTETLVNQVLHSGPRMADFEAGDAAASAAEQPQGMAYTFEARRKFQQVLGAQTRASNERRFLSSQQRLARSLTSSTGGLRGAGAHSTSAPAGTRGHFHNGAAHHVAEDSVAWPGSLQCRLDGEHIDHSLAPEMKPNPKFSKMDAKERAGQFSCYFGAKVHDNDAVKRRVANDQVPDAGSWSYVEHEFRHDVPQRHGKFGRRAFDPLVRELPLNNPHGISEVETKPTEEFRRQQDRVNEFLERAIPHEQERHFQTYKPRCETVGKYNDMATGEQVLSIMESGVKRPQHGFFQVRHSDQSDMKVYTRPLGASQMDRLIPLA